LVPLWFPTGTFSEVKAGLRTDCTDQYLARFPGRRGSLGPFQPSAHCDSNPEKARVSCSTSNCGLPLLRNRQSLPLAQHFALRNLLRPARLILPRAQADAPVDGGYARQRTVTAASSRRFGNSCPYGAILS
jgi:hypothetical protein